jgi:hypothetical protein
MFVFKRSAERLCPRSKGFALFRRYRLVSFGGLPSGDCAACFRKKVWNALLVVS